MGFIGMYFTMTDVLLRAKMNVLSFDGVTLTNKSLLFLYNACINITVCHLFPLPWAHTLL